MSIRVKLRLNILFSANILSILLFCVGCKSPYSDTENQVYRYASTLKNSIPEDFQKNGGGYHDAGENYEKGKARFVAKSPLAVGYAEQTDPTVGMLFMHITPEDDFTDMAEEIIAILKGENAIVYMREGTDWKKGNCEFELPIDDLMYIEDCLKNVLKTGQNVDTDMVKRYIKLSETVRETYF